MKTFIFNSELMVFCANASTKQEAQDLINAELFRMQIEFTQDSSITEEQADARRRNWLNYEWKELEQAYKNRGIILEDNQAKIYYHSND